MNLTLPLTLLLEGVIASWFARRWKKPTGGLLAASLLANLLTQSLLWGLLNLFFAHYLLTLLVTELFIWPLEGLVLRYFPGTRLGWQEALTVSLGMNLVSFGLGWFLPV